MLEYGEKIYRMAEVVPKQYYVEMDKYGQFAYFCNETDNEYFQCYASSHYKHHGGVVAHAKYWKPSGQIEEIDKKYELRVS